MKNLIIRYLPVLIIILYGCELSKPRAEGADNELVLVSSFDDRDDIDQYYLSYLMIHFILLSQNHIIKLYG